MKMIITWTEEQELLGELKASKKIIHLSLRIRVVEISGKLHKQ